MKAKIKCLLKFYEEKGLVILEYWIFLILKQDNLNDINK